VGKARVRLTVWSLMVAVALLAATPALARAARAVGVIAPNTLITFDTSSPGSGTFLPISGLGANQTVRGIDVRPADGQLYAVAVTTGSAANSVLSTYRVDPGTGAATFVGATAAALAGGADVPTGWDFNPVVDRIRYVNTNDENARINPTDGALAANDTDLTPAATSTVVAAAYDRNQAGATATTLFAIDRNDSQLALQGGVNGTPSPNGGVIIDIGALGFALSASADAGFDIAPSGIAYAALTSAADTLTRLYTVNLTTGAATAVGPIGIGASEVRSLAILPEPPAPPAPPPTPPPPTPLAADTVVPSMSDFALVPNRFRVASQATPVDAGVAQRRHRAPRGSRLRFTLSEAADVRVLIERALPGRRVGRRCKPPTRKLRGRRRCTRFKRVGTLRRSNRPAGRNEFPFSGRIGRRALAPGGYRARITATDPAGNRSRARRGRFTIVRR
jgi:Domain of unknown function (DUF4394)